MKKSAVVAYSVAFALMLAFGAPAPAAQATDAGDTPATAAFLPIGSEFDGDLSTSNTRDVIRFDLPTAGLVDVQFQSTAVQPALALLDADFKVVSQEIFKLYLAQGTHYLRVERYYLGAPYSRTFADTVEPDQKYSGSYILKVGFTSSQESFAGAEGAGKTPADAPVIALGKTYRGQLSAPAFSYPDDPRSDIYKGGADLYRLTVAKKTRVQIKASGSLLDSGDLDLYYSPNFCRSYVMSYCDDNPVKVLGGADFYWLHEISHEAYNDRTWSDSAILPAGTYYLAFNTVNDAGGKYTFSVSRAKGKLFKKAPTPKITGTAQVGKTLKVKRGTWSPNPKWFGYEWMRCDAAGASCVPTNSTASRYTVDAADVGHTIRVWVNAGRHGYLTDARMSRPTKVVRSAA